jgi:CubicO group peptidase (beta-lactamase class C family)
MLIANQMRCLLLLVLPIAIALSGVPGWQTQAVAEDLPKPQPGPVGAAGVKRLSEHLEAVRAQDGLPAMAAAVIVNGKPILVAAVGERKIGSGVRVTSDDLFHLGSCTKAMTAFLIERLVDKGHLKHESRINALCPRLRRSMHREQAGLTLQHCLTHRGGFVGTARTFDGIPKKSMSLNGASARLDYARRMLALKPLNPIGTKYGYSNVGHTIAAVVAEEKMRRSWETLMNEEIFFPLEMTSVGYGAAGSARKIDQPWPHKYEDKKHIPVPPGPMADNAELIGPAARAHCSMSDWAKFAAEVLRASSNSSDSKNSLLSPQARKRLLTPPYEGGRYAGGWLVGRHRVYGNVLSHDGTNMLNQSLAYLVPDKQFGVLIATNSGHPQRKQACDILKIRVAADWLFGGMDHVDLSYESYRINDARQWIGRIQNDLLERGKRFLAPDLYEYLNSKEGLEICGQLKKQGKLQEIQFVGRSTQDGVEFSVYRATFATSTWRIEYAADRKKRITTRLRFQTPFKNGK